MIIVRYADDAVLGFQDREDAERFLEQLRERGRKLGLELHPDKTRLMEFGRYAAERRKKRGEGKPETFNLLGFTHSYGTNHTTGNFTVIRKTIGKKDGGEAERNSGSAAHADARADSGDGAVAATGGAGVFPISRHSGQLGAEESVPERCAAYLVAKPSAAKPAEPSDRDGLSRAFRSPASSSPNPSAVS